MDDIRKHRSASEPERAMAPGPKRRTAGRDARQAARGDVAPRLTARGIEDFSVSEAVDAATESKAYAVQDILARAAQGDPSGLIDAFDAILAGASPEGRQPQGPLFERNRARR